MITQIPELSSDKFLIYTVDEGVMMMKDTESEILYYFPSTRIIEPEIIKSRPVHRIEDLSDLIENLE